VSGEARSREGARERAARGYLARQAGRSAEGLLEGLRAGDRGALARALTLVESHRPEHRRQARELIDACLREGMGADAERTFRIGVTGVPGAGKSTFIEALGMHWIERGHRVAVQAVDPSSAISGGSILGDKTRMERLSAHGDAFVRPSPSRGTLGGVTDRTREYLLLFEAAGYDRLIVETVGVGQSETAVHGMVDGMLLLLIPGAGDELQGIKRGIVEMADWIVVNKADGSAAARAAETEADYRRALHLFPPTETGWSPPVVRCSALTGEGLPHVAERLEAFRAHMADGGHLVARRRRQAGAWMHDAIRDALTADFYGNPAIAARLRALEEQVRAGQWHPLLAAERLLAEFAGGAG
jgi:LAO/AO transport system kinase